MGAAVLHSEAHKWDCRTLDHQRPKAKWILSSKQDMQTGEELFGISPRLPKPAQLTCRFDPAVYLSMAQYQFSFGNPVTGMAILFSLIDSLHSNMTSHFRTLCGLYYSCMLDTGTRGMSKKDDSAQEGAWWAAWKANGYMNTVQPGTKLFMQLFTDFARCFR